MPTLSVVIPTYQMAALLGRGLEFWAAQKLGPEQRLQVVVVDDGSSDDTAAVVESFRDRIEDLIYVFVPRTETSGRATARNAGLARCTGDVVSYVDAGVAVTQEFTQTVLAHLFDQPPRVLVHYVFGYQLGATHAVPLEDISPATFSTLVPRLARDPDCTDPREGVFVRCRDELDRLPAPWIIAWTTALSMQRHAALEFNPRLTGWGGEDTELAYRMALSGASFVLARDAPVLHFPHPPMEHKDDKWRGLIAAHEQLMAAGLCRETELFGSFPNLYLYGVLDRLDALGVQTIAPYTSTDLRAIAMELVGRTLTIGIDDVAVAAQLPATHMLVHNRAAQARLAEQFVDRNVRCLVGCHTGEPDKSFDVVLISELVRFVPMPIARAMLKEAARIGRRVVVLAHKGWAYMLKVMLARDEQMWRSVADLQQIARAEGLNLTAHRSLEHADVLLLA